MASHSQIFQCPYQVLEVFLYLTKYLLQVFTHFLVIDAVKVVRRVSLSYHDLTQLLELSMAVECHGAPNISNPCMSALYLCASPR